MDQEEKVTLVLPRRIKLENGCTKILGCIHAELKKQGKFRVRGEWHSWIACQV